MLFEAFHRFALQMAGVAQQLVVPYFDASYRNYPSYPTNLIYRASYRKVLESYKNRLDNASEALFSRDTSVLDVRFRDFNDAQKGQEWISQ